MAFGAMVRQVMAGRDYRAEAHRIGVHYGTLYQLARGPPGGPP